VPEGLPWSAEKALLPKDLRGKTERKNLCDDRHRYCLGPEAPASSSRNYKCGVQSATPTPYAANAA